MVSANEKLAKKTLIYGEKSFKINICGKLNNLLAYNIIIYKKSCTFAAFLEKRSHWENLTHIGLISGI